MVFMELKPTNPLRAARVVIHAAVAWHIADPPPFRVTVFAECAMGPDLHNKTGYYNGIYLVQPEGKLFKSWSSRTIRTTYSQQVALKGV
jgi:hypothetical protein